ncbi:spore germination protein [Bacillus cereus]|uniref:GerAB/ArcD/ProY family transporter n=1 Tax=Bacillus TaxID=1386 RepID=UPI0024BA2FF1|nr:GerAB/ArcD/ProY family transporter [Bacillus cereus]WHS75913.1 spore germination protein [Bacillus cereus]
MNLNQTNTITSRQFFYILIQFQIGISLLSLPHTTYAVAGKSAWLFILFLGILIQIATILFWRIGRQFPKQHFFSYLPSLTGNVCAKIITFFFTLYFLIAGSMISFYFCHILKLWVLPHTPSWFINLLLVGTAVYATTKGLQVMGYVLILSFPCILFLLVLLSFSFTDMPFFEFFPVSSFPLSSLFHSSTEYILAFTGFEAFLFLYPFIKGTEKQKVKSALLANLFTNGCYVYVVLVTLFHLAPSQIRHMTEPVLYVLRTLPISVFFRVDLVFLSIWMICVTTSMILYVFLASHSLPFLFSSPNPKRKKWILIGIAIIMYTLSLLPQNEKGIHFFIQTFATISIVFTSALPALLLLLSSIKRKRSA